MKFQISGKNCSLYPWPIGASRGIHGERHAGLIAQEVQEVLPEAVTQDAGGTLSVAYGNMVALLIEAIKEQQVQITELKRRIS